MTSLKLYGFWRSSATWRVRIGLHYKGLSFDYQPVDLHNNGGEQHSEAYRSLNPMGQVPLLVVEEGGRTAHLTQSIAILEYLEERYPEPRLLPADRLLRAQARRLAEIVNAGIQPFQNTSTQAWVRDTLKADITAWLQKWIPLGLEALEASAAASAGRFAVGDAVSVADICIVPQIAAARRMELDLSPYPTLTRIEAACEALPAFQQAHADRQQDAPREP